MVKWPIKILFPPKRWRRRPIWKAKNMYMENAGADRMAYMTINDKNCNLPIVDKKLQKNHV